MSIKYSEEFINSKREELSFLSSLVTTALPVYDSRVWDYLEFIEYKFKLMQQIRSEKIKNITEPVTKRTPKSFKWGDFNYQYLYQRQGLSITLNEELISYPIKTVAEVNFEFFTSSGQSATLCVFEFIKNEFPKLVLKFLENNPTYYESDKIIQLCNVPIAKGGKCFFYDGTFSYSLNWLKENLKGIDLFVFDTTLFAYGHAELQEIIDHLLVLNVPTFLIRSHLKLDSLGAEFSSLGSVSAINMNSLKTLESGRGCKTAIASYLSITGSYAAIDQMYPFLGNSQFVNITSNRCERIKKFGKVLTAKLELLTKEQSYPFSILKTWHSYYFYLEYPSSIEVNMQNEFEKIKIISGIPSFYCDSFGFDFLAFTCVPVLNKQNNNYLYRFSTPDLGLESMDSIIDFFAIFLKNLNDKLTKLSL
jgi:hypothetical protein